MVKVIIISIKKICDSKLVPNRTTELPKIDPIKKLVNTIPYIKPFELLLLTETKNCAFREFKVTPKKKIEIPITSKYKALELVYVNKINPKTYTGILKNRVFLCPNLSESFPTQGMGKNCIRVPIDTITPVRTRELVIANIKG
jgi:hypothetical protein